jgi:hypothetical protein
MTGFLTRAGFCTHGADSTQNYHYILNNDHTRLGHAALPMRVERRFSLREVLVMLHDAVFLVCVRICQQCLSHMSYSTSVRKEGSRVSRARRSQVATETQLNIISVELLLGWPFVFMQACRVMERLPSQDTYVSLIRIYK